MSALVIVCKVEVVARVTGRRPMQSVLAALDSAELSGGLAAASVDFMRGELDLSVVLTSEFCSSPKDGQEKVRAILSDVKSIAITRMRAWVAA